MMIDLSMILLAGLGTAGTALFGWLFLKERTDKNNILIKVGILEHDLKTLHEKLESSVHEISSAHEANNRLGEEYRKLLNQKKSSEVRVGKIGEHLAPFLDDWPYDPNSFRFIGNPIDGISFTQDGIVFIEIKTGKSRLSSSQKHVKQLIKEGKVCFATFRIDGSGCVFEVEDKNEKIDL